MKITFYGHACLSVEINGKTILFDPFITPNELAKSVDVNSIRTDYILISHGHEDHVADVELIHKNNPEAVLVSNFEIVSWFQQKGINNSHPMNIGGKWSFDFGTVKYVNAIHSSTMPDGKSGGNPGGFVISTNDKNFYYAGDTAFFSDMKHVADQTIDFAMLPIGDNFTMGIEDAVKAAQTIGCKTVIAMHFDTFGYIKVNHEEAKKNFKDANINFHLMEIGESINL